MKSIHTKLKADGFEGCFFPLEGSDRCMITLVDSEGDGIISKAIARWFGRHGCCSLGLGKWQDHTRRDGLSEWPLEYFGKAIAWLQRRGIVKIGVYGISFGGNMALMAASLYPDLTFTVVCEAIDIVMEGFEEGKKEGMSEWCCGKSTFSFRGEALPYLPYAVKLFRSGRKNGKKCKEARKQLDSLLAEELGKW